MANSELKERLPLIAAVVLGLLGIVLVNKYVNTATTPEEVKKTKVLCAAASIEAGETITPEHVTLVSSQGNELPAMKDLRQEAVSAVHIKLPSGNSPMEKEQMDERRLMLVGRKVQRDIDAGEPILWSDLIDEGTSTLSRKLRPRRRAITIGVDALTSVGYNIVPGDHVDVLVTLQPQLMTILNERMPMNAANIQQSFNADKDMETLTTVIMQDVLVLATGTALQRNNARGKQYSSITLDVSLQESILLTHARSQGVLSFIVRPPESVHRMESEQLKEIEVKDSSLRERVGALDVRRAETIHVLHPENIESSVFEEQETK